MSKTLVICSSGTGNTRIIAHAVADAANTLIVNAADVPADLSDVTNVALCFWCDRGMAPEDIKAIAPKLSGKKIACFCTMGGDPTTERSKEWIEKTARELAGDANEIVATFLCRGRIDPALFARMSAMQGGKADPEREARRDASETHPDRMDVLHAQEVFAKAFGEN